jgi:phospholipid/cholesterol/gamma-HCH transport system permease protein
MKPPSCEYRVNGAGAGGTLVLSGAWRIDSIPPVAQLLGRAKLARPVSLDGSAVQALDSAAALALLRALEQAGIARDDLRVTGFSAAQQRVLEAVRGQAPASAKPEASRTWLADFGRKVVAQGPLLTGQLSFLGATIEGLVEVLLHPRRLRVKELTAQLEQVCLNAIPVVVLVTMLIGVTFAYLLGLQAEKFGAGIFVVDGVAVGMTREFGPLIVAVVIAGRTGAAFTAQLGSMRLAEEVDAIRTLGLSPMQVLIVPRVLALMLGLPLLVLLGAAMGIVGAMLLAGPMLGITTASFLDRLHESLDVIHIWVGLGKAPFFAAAIALIGCRMGMTAGRDTRAVGLATTSTVVQCIVSVIVLDAIAAIVCQEMDW